MAHDFRRAEGDADAVGDTGSVKALHQVAFGLELLDQLTWLTFVGDPDQHEISMTRQRCKAQSRNIFLQQLSAPGVCWLMHAAPVAAVLCRVRYCVC